MKPVVSICIASLGNLQPLQKPQPESPSSQPGQCKYFLLNERKLIHPSSPHFGMSLYAWMKMKIWRGIGNTTCY